MRLRKPVDGSPDNRSKDLCDSFAEQLDQLREIVEDLRSVVTLHIEASRIHTHGRPR